MWHSYACKKLVIAISSDCRDAAASAESSYSSVKAFYSSAIGSVLNNEKFLVTWVASCASAVTIGSFLSNSMLDVGL